MGSYSGEVVAVVNPEDSAVDIQVLLEVEVAPGVVIKSAVIFRHFMSFEENALRDSRIFDLGLSYVNRVVVEVVEDHAFADSEVLGLVFVHCLLEVGIETEHLAVVLQPLGWRLRHGVIGHLLSGGHLLLGSGAEGRGCAILNGLKQLLVHLDIPDLVAF